jgi:hypothetical protein
MPSLFFPLSRAIHEVPGSMTQSEMSSQKHVAHVFKTGSVERIAPASPGVYGLSNSREWIYIGATDNIKARLQEHLVGTNTLVSARGPTGFFFELCALNECAALQSRLIHEFEPVCNQAPAEQAARRWRG